MYKVCYMTIAQLILCFEEYNKFNERNILINHDDIKYSLIIDSILLGVPIRDIVIQQNDNNFIIRDELIRIIYIFLKGKNNNNFNWTLSNSKAINYRWRGKGFGELSNELKERFTNTTVRVIYIPNNFTKYYK